MTDTTTDPDEYDSSVIVETDDDRVEGHTFKKGYEKHDIGEAHVTRHLEHMGFEVEPWGIDMRNDQSVLGDDKMDLKVFRDTTVTENGIMLDTVSELAALLEVKVKTNDGWFGIVNRHHFRKYLRRTHEHDVPAFVYMAFLDEDDEAITRDTFIPVQQWDELTAVLRGEYDYYTPDSAEQFLVDQIERHPQIERTFRAPDGNQVVKLDVETGIGWTELTHVLRQ